MRQVLLIANYKGPIGGISGQVEMLYQCLSKEGYVSDIFTTHGNPIKRIGMFFRLLCVARRYDVMHIHGCSEWGMLPIVYSVIAGKIWRKRIIVTYHGGGADEYFAKHGSFAKRWLGRADKVIVLNGYLEKVFAKYEIPCIVIPNIIELSDAQTHSPYQWEKTRLISVRHLEKLYNIPCILRAFAIVKEQIPNAALTILGDGPQRAELEQMVAADERIADSVQFVGQVKSSEMAGYLAKSDILLSAPHIDNMPVSVMEAMNAGTLVISSRVGGVPYMIEDGVSGMLFADDDAEGMAKCILQAIANPKQTGTMIARAKRDVAKYNWKEVRKRLLPLYESEELRAKS